MKFVLQRKGRKLSVSPYNNQQLGVYVSLSEEGQPQRAILLTLDDAEDLLECLEGLIAELSAERVD